MLSPSSEQWKLKNKKRELLIYSFIRQACIKDQGFRDALVASTDVVLAFKAFRSGRDIDKINKIIRGDGSILIGNNWMVVISQRRLLSGVAVYAESWQMLSG